MIKKLTVTILSLGVFFTNAAENIDLAKDGNWELSIEKDEFSGDVLSSRIKNSTRIEDGSLDNLFVINCSKGVFDTTSILSQSVSNKMNLYSPGVYGTEQAKLMIKVDNKEVKVMNVKVGPFSAKLSLEQTQDILKYFSNGYVAKLRFISKSELLGEKTSNLTFNIDGLKTMVDANKYCEI